MKKALVYIISIIAIATISFSCTSECYVSKDSKLGISFIDSVSPYTEVINFEYNEENVFSEDLFYDGFHLDVYSGLPLFTQMLFDR